MDPWTTLIRPSLSPSPRRASAGIGYRHAGCLQLSHVRTADPSADRSRSAASRAAISSRGLIVSPPPGAITCFSLFYSVHEMTQYELWKCCAAAAVPATQVPRPGRRRHGSGRTSSRPAQRQDRRSHQVDVTDPLDTAPLSTAVTQSTGVRVVCRHRGDSHLPVVSRYGGGGSEAKGGRSRGVGGANCECGRRSAAAEIAHVSEQLTN